jgi:hypothetical protein
VLQVDELNRIVAPPVNLGLGVLNKTVRTCRDAKKAALAYVIEDLDHRHESGTSLVNKVAATKRIAGKNQGCQLGVPRKDT